MSRGISRTVARLGLAVSLSVGLLGQLGVGWLLRAQSLGARSAVAEVPDPTAKPGFVGALGTVEPWGRTRRVAAPASAQGATLGQLYVDEGQVVAQGHLMATLDNLDQLVAETSAALARVSTALAQLNLVRAGTDPQRLESLTAELAESKLAAEFEMRESSRFNELARRQTVSASDREERDVRARRSQMVVRRISALLEEARRVRAEDLAVAEAQLAEARAALEATRSRLEQARIRAPIAGTILKVHARAGEKVGERGIVEIGDLSRMAVVAEIYEADMPRVTVGAAADVRLKTTPIQLRGQVRELGRMVGRKVALDNDPVTDTDARVVEVRIELDSESSRLVAGLSNARVDVKLTVAPLP